MIKYTLNIDLNDKDLKIQKIDILEAYKILENILINNEINGFTIYQAKGVYKHDNGTITAENSLIVYVYDFNEHLEKNIKMAADMIKKTLNQESIAIETQNINSYLY